MATEPVTQYGSGGFDPSKPNNNILGVITREVPDAPVIEVQADPAAVRAQLSALDAQIELAKASVKVATTIAALRTATLALDDLRGQQAALLSQTLA